ncbi:hypothetical protein [Tunturiibacter gelidiferens]|uniref:hypothetical protein n=1 Tax=Tunturiibacter gelidiferens TaxID=3069689 RepID=UPI003D9B1476
MPPATALASFNQTEPEPELVERIPMHQARAIMKPAPSLKPGPSMMDGCLIDEPESLAIRDAWRFAFPIRTVTREQFEEMTTRNTVVFNA